MIVSPGRLSDAPQIYRVLSEEMWPEVGQGEINPVKAYERIWDCLETGFVYNVWDEGELAGTVGFIETSPWWSDETKLSDSWIYVRKDWRRTRAIHVLMGQVKRLAFKRPVYIGIGSDVDIERKTKLFGRFGKMVGALYRVE